MISVRPTSWLAMLAPLVAMTPAQADLDLTALGIDPSQTILVTAQRTETRIENTLTRATVITRQDIERSQARDLKALLQTQAGIDITRTGGAGGQTSVFMRGTNSNHVLVLIDGVRVAASSTGGFQWELVDLATVERIEIVRGPQAARWGSDAIGGVIQIFTRQAQGFGVQTSTGSYGEWSAAVSLGGASQSITASTRRLDGFSAQNARGFAFDPDKDGYTNHQVAGSGQYEVGSGTLNITGRWLTGEVEFDQGISDVEQYAGQLGYQVSADGWVLNVEGALYRDRLETATAFGQTENITRRIQTSVIAERTLSDDLLWLVGVDGWKASGVSVNSWRESRSHWGVWSALDGQYNMLSYSASVRLDDDERFGQETTAQLALGWQWGESVRLFANAGQGFRSPNFSQLFSPGFGGLFAGNPQLGPETSVSYELGLDWDWSRDQAFSASVFHTDIDDLINFSGPNFQAINIKKARIEGIELVHRFSRDPWSSEVSWTWQDPKDQDLNQPLLRRPEQKAAWVVGHAWGNHFLGAELIYIGSRVDIGQAALSSYALVNLRAQWALSDDWTIKARIENLLDRDYEPLVGFNAAGLSGQLTLQWRPQR